MPICTSTWRSGTRRFFSIAGIIGCSNAAPVCPVAVQMIYVATAAKAVISIETWSHWQGGWYGMGARAREGVGRVRVPVIPPDRSLLPF